MSDTPLRMLHALLLTRISNQPNDVGVIRELMAVTSEGQSLLIRSEEAQRVNVAQLESQRLPLVLLCDRLEPSLEADLELPARALVSVVPLPSPEVEALIRAGQEQVLLEQIRAQLG